MRLALVLSSFIFLISCGTENEKKEAESIVQENIPVDTSRKAIDPVGELDVPHSVIRYVSSVKDTSFSYRITREENGFGYEILHQRQVMIRQPHIPAVQGNSGFASEKDAASVAALVIEKLSKGISPPSETTEELIKLGIPVKDNK
ncbi:MAG: DUF4907 domain-containing protein [Flavobacteriales bacterium]